MQLRTGKGDRVLDRDPAAAKQVGDSLVNSQKYRISILGTKLNFDSAGDYVYEGTPSTIPGGVSLERLTHRRTPLLYNSRHLS